MCGAAEPGEGAARSCGPSRLCTMNNLIRGLIAGYGAKKLGGGCFSTILVFVLIWMALGMCGSAAPPADPAPAAVVTTLSAPASPPAVAPAP